MLGRLITKRLALSIIQLFGASIVIFALVRQLPGDPAVSQLGSTAGPEQIEALRERLHLNDPVPVQYAIWIRDLFRGDLGRSNVTGNAVTTDLADRIPATLELITISLLAALVLLVPLGVFTARMAKRWYSRAVNRSVFTYGLFAGSMPDFWLAQLLLFLIFFKLGWAPAPLGRVDLMLGPPDDVTGLYTLDSLIAADWGRLRDAVVHLVLPIVTLVFVYGAPILKMTRANITKNLDSEFVQQAKSAGIGERAQLAMAFKNSLPPIITLAGITYGFVIGGAVLVETIFSWGGLGQYAVLAISNADFNAIQGFVLVATVVSIFIFLLVDIVHYMVDPRIRAS